MKLNIFPVIRKPIQYIQNIQTNYIKTVRQHISNPNGYTIPGFLVGCGRSGTTMLVFQLGKSWQIQPYNENNPAAFEKFHLRDLSIIMELVKCSYAPITLFKPILDTYRTQTFLSHFPESKVVFVYRNYNDVINSSLKMFGSANRIGHVRAWIEDDYNEFLDCPPPDETKKFILDRWEPSFSPETGAALFWLFQNRLYFDLNLYKDERVYLVQYEALISEPHKEFNVLCNFLGIRFEHTMIKGLFTSSVKRDAPPQIKDDIRADCEELWQTLCQYTKEMKNFIKT